jgi:hypothetical protein
MAITRSLMNRQLYQLGGGAIYPRIDGLSSGISEAEQMLQQINQSIDQVQSTLGESSGGPQGQLVGGNSTNIIDNNRPPGGYPKVPALTDIYAEAQKSAQDQRAGGFLGQVILPGEMGFEDFSNTYNAGGFQKRLLGPLSENPMSGGPMQSPLASAMRSTFADGGMMGRQMYGLGSLVKSITKGVKKIVKSPLGKAALLAGGAYFAPTLFGNFGNLIKGGITQALPAAKSFLGGEKTFGKTAAMFAAGSLLPLVLGDAEQSGDLGVTRNVDALRTKLTNAYKNQRTFSDAADEDSAVAAQVQSDLSEYTSGAGGYANGGRIGYAYGDVVDQASGIMGLPKRVNQAGVKELDLRDSGGFIPPVGVKEKADDIPAMLSNNEFVFTAESVRNMGNGDVNKGAQRMYDIMKYLEKGGRV